MPISVRMGIDCRFGFVVDNRPVDATVWLNVVCRRPSVSEMSEGNGQLGCEIVRQTVRELQVHRIGRTHDVVTISRCRIAQDRDHKPLLTCAVPEPMSPEPLTETSNSRDTQQCTSGLMV